MMNEHVYKYYRFKAWVALQVNYQLKAALMYSFAEFERLDQQGCIDGR